MFKLLLCTLLALMVLAVVAVVIGLIPSGNAEVVGLVVLTAIGLSFSIVILIGWRIVDIALQRRRVAEILAYIEQAVRLNLPLPRTFRAIAEGESPRLARRLLQATVALEQGEPLASALGTLPRFPARIIGLVAAAERVGRLPHVLHRIIEQRRANLRRNASFSIPFYRTYPLIVGLALLVVAWMLLVFVFPKFESIFKDFRIQPPWITRATFAAADAVGPWGALLVGVILIAGFLGTVWARWAGGSFGLVESPGAWILNRTPWLGAMRMYNALGESLEFAAGAVEAGRPVEDSLVEASAIASNPIARRKLRDWARRLVHGESLPEAARSARLPRLIAGLTATATHTADLTEVFRFLGRYYASRFSRAMAILQGMYVPAMVLVMGSLVAWLALSIFLPMIALMDILTPMQYRP